jgi:phage shock protein C
MDEESDRPCPFCAEMISPAALRCPHCRSRIYARNPRGWHRSHPGKKLGGVCVALAHALAIPVTPVRLAFVVLTLLSLTGAIAYLALWLVIPEEPGHEPQVVRAFSWATDWVRRMFGKGPRDGGPTEVGRVP